MSNSAETLLTLCCLLCDIGIQRCKRQRHRPGDIGRHVVQQGQSVGIDRQQQQQPPGTDVLVDKQVGRNDVLRIEQQPAPSSEDNRRAGRAKSLEF